MYLQEFIQRSYLEGRFDDKHLNNFRRDLNDGMTYPHPWLMPDYWQFATVSMGLAQFKQYIKQDL